jgi:hypothetical protein
MKQPWINKKKYDLLFILAPPFVIAFIVIIFQQQILNIQNEFSFLNWLILIVCIDVAHVYASIFKTYLVPTEFKKNQKLYLGIPIICFIIGTVAFLIGKNFFWSLLAYIAVFHFIRQQYGFMRLYARNEIKTPFSVIFDKVVIYNATLYPMLFWFLNPNRNFNWFVKNEFIQGTQPQILSYLNIIYIVILACYIIKILYNLIKIKYINEPKTLLILGTYISWYLSIVHYNNELIFTAFNVISHGIPYMALVYFKEIKDAPSKKFAFKIQNHTGKLISFILILIILAITEEFIWEVTVWEEHIQLNQSFYIPDFWQFLWVPLLALPQFTHYILDGFIWKNKKSST